MDLVVDMGPGDMAEIVPHGVRVFELGAPRARQFTGPFMRYLLAEKPDVVLSAMWPYTSASVLAKHAARSQARVVVTEHTTLSEQYKNRGLAHLLALRTSLAVSHRLADACIAVSGGVADDLASLAAMPRNRLNVIHNAIWLDTNQTSGTGIAETAWEGYTGPRILAVGHLKAVKNHALLISAFRKLLNIKEARLMILGDGELAQSIKDQARLEGL